MLGSVRCWMYRTLRARSFTCRGLQNASRYACNRVDVCSCVEGRGVLEADRLRRGVPRRGLSSRPGDLIGPCFRPTFCGINNVR